MEEFELDDDLLMQKAVDKVAILMKSEEPDFAIASIVALRDWLSDYYDADTAYEICSEIAEGIHM